MNLFLCIVLVFLPLFTYAEDAVADGGTSEAASEESIAAEPVDDSFVNDPGFYSFVVQDMDGRDVPLAEYFGRVALVVNVASNCGYTDSTYKDLVNIQSKFEPTGLFSVLAFPCNQFYEQEPGTNEEIFQFAAKNYGANFPLFGKIEVTGDNASEAWQYLANATGYAPQWNFWKYLIDHTGHVVDVWSHETPAADLEGWIEDTIAKAMPDVQMGDGESYPHLAEEFASHDYVDEPAQSGINPDHHADEL